MKKLFILCIVALSLNSLRAQVPCQNIFANPACDNILNNLGPGFTIFTITFGGTPLFQGPTCGPALFFPPGAGPVTGDLLIFDVTECNTYNWSTCGLVGFDSYLRVWSATPPFQLLAASDDLAFGCGLLNPFASAVTWNATFTGQVFVSVNDYGAPAFSSCDNSGLPYGLFLQCTPGTCPDNNNVCDATKVKTKKCKTVTVPFDNTFATADGPSPGPGTTGPAPTCDAVDGWCNLAIIAGGFIFAAGDPCVQNDVWFCFKAPGKGTVTIESVLDNLGAPDFGDTQLAVWAPPPGCGKTTTTSDSNSGSGSGSGSSDDSSDDKRRGCCCPDDAMNLIEVAANDDGGNVLGSRLVLTVGPAPSSPSSPSNSNSGSGSGSSSDDSDDAGPPPDLISGQEYFIQIDGFNDPAFAPFVFPPFADGLARGTGTLSIRHEPPKGCATTSTTSSDDKRGEFAEEMAEENDRTMVEAFPNPFSSTTTISFTLGQDGHATLEVFNTTGARVALLHNSEVKAGVKTNVEFDATNLPVGIYTYRLTTGNKVYHDKLSVVK